MAQLIDLTATVKERTHRLRERARDRVLTAIATRLDVGKVESVDAQPLGTGDHRVVDAATFRGVMSSFPSGVGVVTTLDDEGQPRGFTCSAICSVSLDPPLMLVCVDRRSGSLRAIRHSNGFVVNFLGKDAAEVSQVFASPENDKFGAVEWQPNEATGLPVLNADALAYADCRLEREILAGDHAIVIGCIRDGGVPDPSHRPLLYWRRQYASWPGSVDHLANAS
jgi:flavin reductase (DIM6/NTAB) family NADH-FMN oxidoreductase RutF